MADLSDMRGRVAIVTGGGSGIGAALVRAMAGRGATIMIADIDEAAGKSVAAELDQVSAVTLDVRDAAAVADLVAQTKAEHGQIDYMFNNAGIAVGGLVEEFTLDHWDRVIDVNLRGVIHGVHAAYPVMLAQGNGHIVNTASLAGLIPGPGLAPYDATKHAVVGLSLSLRAEAGARGVKVSAICPGFVDTPLLGRVNPDLPKTSAGMENAGDVSKIVGPLYKADLLAQDVLRGLAKNKPLIVAPRSARVLWRMTRYAPNFALNTITKTVQRRAGSQA
ncbi:MAG TPA: SDR family oxidoreductase [Streptosporangiaceae bacterium]|nr:SDR family oxidoreductase [Streptosporangiaceae bacterium]